MDVFGPARASTASPAVLLWHGRGPDERGVLAPLARTVAQQGVVVFVPDWSADTPDGGLTHLTESVAFVRHNAAGFGGDSERITLAGWSLGGKAAVGIALSPWKLGGWRPHAVVGMAGGYRIAAPTTGSASIDDLFQIDNPVSAVPVRLVHGHADAVVDIEQSRELHVALKERGWPVSFEEIATDHAGVVMTEYSPEQNRCVPTTADPVLRAGARTASLLAHAASAPAH